MFVEHKKRKMKEWTEADSGDVMRKAAELGRREHAAEVEGLGLLPPSHNIDPLDPPLSMYQKISALFLFK